MYEDTPDDIVHDLLAKAAYGEHSLGYPILGTDKHLNSFTREDLFAYKDTFYNPSNVVISVAGNVDTEFITKVEDYFNQFENESKTNKIEKPIFIADDLRRFKNIEQATLNFCFYILSFYDE